MDLLNIVLIGLSNELPERDEKNELHRLLAALLSIELSVDERLDILEMEYDIPIENNMRKDVSIMCNLSLGILERGRAEGEARGEARGEVRGEARGEARIIANMYKNGFTVEQIASATDKSVEEVKAIIENSESILV